MGDESHDSDTIDFERAEFAQPAPADVACDSCKRSVGAHYWQLGGQVLCDGCRAGLEQVARDVNTGRNFLRAALKAAGVALACGVAYAIFVAVTKVQLALVSIGIGYLIARTVQGVTRGLGGRRFRVLAVALTYVASSMGYLPAVLTGLSHIAARQATHAAAGNPPSTAATVPPAATATATPTATPTASATSPAPAPPHKPMTALGAIFGLLVLLALVVAMTLAAPFYGGFMGAIIVGLALWEAWKLSRGGTLPFTGPHAVAAPAPSTS